MANVGLGKNPEGLDLKKFKHQLADVTKRVIEDI